MAADLEFLEYEGAYKKPGNTLFSLILGDDPFDFWIGRYYVGFFGAASLVTIALGVTILFIAVGQYGDWDLLRANVPSPDRSIGLGWAPFLHGGAWQSVVILATASFVFWGLREVDICRKLEMGFHIPRCSVSRSPRGSFCKSCVRCSWVAGARVSTSALPAT